MAILSNINGKFAVDSTGAVQFNGAAGTSGYILKSNGTGSAPTWVDGSTVIGGPYLPLSGGTLTGATATASGISFTFGGTAQFDGDMTLPAAADNFDIGFNLSTTGKIRFGNTAWNNSLGLESYWMVLRTNQNEGLKLIDSSGNTYVQLNASNNSAGAYNSIFTGKIGIGGKIPTYGLTLAQGTGVNNKIAWTDGTPSFRASMWANSSDDKFKIATGNASSVETVALEIDTSQNTSFAGNIAAGVAQINVINNQANSHNIIYRSGTTTIVGGGSSSNKLYVLDNGDVGVNVSSPSYKLDVDGTLRTTSSYHQNVNFTNTPTFQIGTDSYSSGFFVYDSTAAQYRMVVKSSTGNVGIGTVSPTAKLEIVGSNGTNIFRGNFGGSADIFMGFDNANPYLMLQDNSNVTTHLFQSNVNNYIVGSNVGIGNTNPQTQLQVTSNTTTKLRVNTTGVADSMVEILGYDAGLHIGDNTNGNRWAIWNDGPGTSTSLNFGSYALGTWYVPGSQVMTMTSDGKVGIGTTSPNTKLSLEDSTVDSAVQISFKNDAREWRWGVNGGMSDAINLYDNTAGYTRFYVSPNGWSYFNNATTGGGIEIYGTGGNYVDFYVTASNTIFSTNASNGFYFNSKIGIGTTSPSGALHVYNGTSERFLITGDVHVQGSTDLNINGTNRRINFTSGNGTVRTTGVGSVIFATNSTERMRILSSGYIGMNEIPSGFATLEIKNISSTTYGLYVDYTDTSASYGAMKVILTGNTTSPSYVDWWTGATQTGSVETTGSSTQYLTSSDYRLKENIVPMSNAIDRVKQLKPSRFNFIGYENTVDGLIAHEVADIVPEAVNGEKDGLRDDGTPKYQGIDEGKLVPLLIGAIQELEARVKELENK